MHGLDVLEDQYPDRPRMRISFYQAGHISVCRIQTVCSRHGDVFYLRAILLHRSARNWIDLRTVDGLTYGNYQEAARAMGLFDNRDGDRGRLKAGFRRMSPWEWWWKQRKLRATAFTARV